MQLNVNNVSSVTEGTSNKCTVIPSSITQNQTIPELEPKTVRTATRITADVITNTPISSIEHKPSIIGEVQKVITFKDDQLEQQFNDVEKDALPYIKNIFKNIISVCDLDSIDALKWGEVEQKRYATLVDATLDIVTYKDIQFATKYLSRLYEILNSISESFQDKKLQEFWKKKQSPFETYQEHKHEINQIKQLLTNTLPCIEKAREELTKLEKEAYKLYCELLALSLSLQWVSEYINGTNKEKAQQYLSRSTNLLETSITIKNGEVIRKENNKSLESMAVKIQQVVLTKLPSWIERICLNKNKDMTETSMFVNKNELSNIIESLKEDFT